MRGGDGGAGEMISAWWTWMGKLRFEIAAVVAGHSSVIKACMAAQAGVLIQVNMQGC